MTQYHAYVDGAVIDSRAPSIALAHRALLYGDGVFTTLRIVQGRALFLAHHLERLQQHASMLHISVAQLEARVEHALHALAARHALDDVVARIMLTRASEPALSLPSSDAHLYVWVRPRLQSPQSVRVTLLPLGLGRDALPTFGAKTHAYLPHLQAKDLAQARGADDALMLDPDGAVREATSANVFLVRDGVLCTPPVEQGILPGVTRAAVLALAHRTGRPVARTLLFPSDFYEASEVFLTSSAAGLVPVSEVDGRPISAASAPFLPALTAGYEALVAGTAEVEIPGLFR